VYKVTKHNQECAQSIAIRQCTVLLSENKQEFHIIPIIKYVDVFGLESSEKLIGEKFDRYHHILERCIRANTRALSRLAKIRARQRSMSLSTNSAARSIDGCAIDQWLR